MQKKKGPDMKVASHPSHELMWRQPHRLFTCFQKHSTSHPKKGLLSSLILKNPYLAIFPRTSTSCRGGIKWKWKKEEGFLFGLLQEVPPPPPFFTSSSDSHCILHRADRMEPYQRRAQSQQHVSGSAVASCWKAVPLQHIQCRRTERAHCAHC